MTHKKPKIIKGDLVLETFSLSELRGKNYEFLRFLCKIWGIENVFKEFYYPCINENGSMCRGNKDEIACRLRAEMRKAENANRQYERRYHIKTPESIRPKLSKK